MIWPTRRLKYLSRTIDRRAGSDQPPLLAVSIHKGVIPRESLTDDLPRAEDLSNYKICEPGDIILNRMRAFQGAIGVSPIRGLVSPDYLVLQPSPHVNAQYLHHLFRSSWFIGEMASRLRGIGGTDNGAVRTPRINPEDLGNIEIPTPSLDEQRWIANFLDVETIYIDRLAAIRDRQLHLLNDRSTAFISEVLPTSGDCQFIRLGYLATIQSGITVDGSRTLSDDAVTRPYIRVANVQAGRLELNSITEISVSEKMAAASTLRFGDVLMTEGGDLDKLGRGTVWRDEIPECLHQNHIFAVRPGASLDSDYLALLTRSIYARNYFESTGTKTTNLASTSSGKIRDFRIPLVSLATQKRIVKETSRTLDRIDSLTNLLIKQKQLLTERRQALITGAVTGQIDVTTAGRGSEGLA
ncbi:hypothetical protein DQ384_24455 [Sphaerisporangium album]|uniref:Uncharacterized protein n=1 Tax=Sphaerisporangium album TaxID=509200 RepID=A0A367FDB9_9ACTN|nr:restriction endonuclease subunit S [Sphaerisporangium album]RCG28281.1 hypothetical protein DQ384_24455 [Sphaerisporangium album]